jgi:hypothetical protein
MDEQHMRTKATSCRTDTCYTGAQWTGNNDVVNNDWGTKTDFAHADELDKKREHIIR